VTVEEQLRAASKRAESDPEFAEQLAYDSVGALRSAGWEALAAEVEREQQHVAEVASRLDGDDEFFNRVASDPDSLADDGIPTEAIALVLLALGAPDELVEKASAEVEAHASIKPTLAVVAVTLGAFGFAGQAVASPHYRPISGSSPSREVRIPEPGGGVVKTVVHEHLRHHRAAAVHRWRLSQ
jgi:hypothetical protein